MSGGERGKANKKPYSIPKSAKTTKHNVMFVKGKEYGCLYKIQFII